MQPDYAIGRTPAWPALFVRGGRQTTPREHAPRGVQLPYRRHAGESPRAVIASPVEGWRRNGWRLVGSPKLGDFLLSLSILRALRQLTGPKIVYRGPRAGLVERMEVPIEVDQVPQHANTFESGWGTQETPMHADPEAYPIWLDQISDRDVEVHGALPMRYYLQLEQLTGERLREDRAPCMRFRASPDSCDPWHVVFVVATNRPRKDYGADSFGRIARALAEMATADWRFSVVTGRDRSTVDLAGFGPHRARLVAGASETACLDLFATSALVVGNDTGLTHLAALAVRDDGSAPAVISIIGKHSWIKWNTGLPHHHAVATPFSQLMAMADACPVRDKIDEGSYGRASDLSAISPSEIARFAARLCGWA